MASLTNESSFKLIDQSAQYGFGLWTLVFDLPGEKVNKLSKKVMEDFATLLPELRKKGESGQIEALVLVSGKLGNFIAGADIELIQATRNAEEATALSHGGQILMNDWEDLPFPTIAAVDGAALGGGCEFALASSYIAISNSSAAKLGLPEVLLGVIPGMGGCVRMPRKVGLATALEIILTGKTLSGDRAYRAGLADVFFPQENFEESVCKWVKSNLEGLKKKKRYAKDPKLGGVGGALGTVLESTPIGRQMLILKKAREGVLDKTRGNYPAPLEAIDVLSDTGATFDEDRLTGDERLKAMKREAEGFGRVAATKVSKNLIRIFFLTEEVKKSKGVQTSDGIKFTPVRSGGVLGAGVMGGGIAQLLAEKNIVVRMKDLNNPALALGMNSASRIFKKQLQRKKINSREYLQKLNLIAPVTDFSGFISTQVVIEAVIEKMDIKQKVLRELEDNVSDECVIASNTSSLSITEMQKAMKLPSRFAGMHFFNPVSKMPLIEVIRGDKSSDHAVSTVYQFSKQLGKTPIVVKDSPGFLVNRLLLPYLNEATWLLNEGAPIPEIDEALLQFGMPMGPIELIDEVGVDVGDKVAHILHAAFGARAEPAPCNPKIVAAGRLGKKNQKGFYDYDPQGRNKKCEDSIYETLGVSPKSGSFSDEEIVERCILPMINEASRCLDEKVVEHAKEVDLGMIMGTGFPPFRGGLLRYADELGAKTVLEKLKKYHARFGARFEPAPRIVKMAEQGTTFH